MAYDGSGTFTVLYNWATEAASPPIAISKLDTEFAGIATGLSSVYTKTLSDARYAALTGATFTGAVTCSSASPTLNFYESNGGSQAKYWRFIHDEGVFYLQTLSDAYVPGSNALEITRTGTTIDSITFAGTTIAVTGNQTVSGTLGVTGVTTLAGNLFVSNTSPAVNFYESNGGSQAKYWRFIHDEGVFYLQTLSDAYVPGSNALEIRRTGTTVDSITFIGTTVAITGNETVSGTLAVTGATTLTGAATCSSTLAVTGNVAVNTNKFTVAAASGNTVVAGTLSVNAIDVTPTAGTFTAALRATVGGADLATATASWSKVGNVVTLRLPSLTATSTSTAYYIQSLPASIRPAVTQSLIVPGYNNSRYNLIAVVTASQDYIQLLPENGSTFDSGSNTKGVVGTCLSYLLV